MADRYTIAIIGSGPGGISAAGRAAKTGTSHILLERTDHLADTLFRFQKGKLVMSTPEVLPLRSELPFAMGQREGILDAWNQGASELKLNVRFNSEVTAVKGSRGDFTITLKDGSTVLADHVILAIGLQGNINKLGVPGSEAPHVQYQLDDPDEYMDETIVVVGAGDAAIENAVALAKQNNVVIINRMGEFARIKQGNLDLILGAIQRGQIECYYNATPIAVGPDTITLKTDSGEAVVKCNRILARIGASPPRAFVESCGVVFPSADRAALPEVSATYESNVPGLFIIGALGGYPLIKQAMNQGYEVVEHICGREVRPADEPLLQAKFAELGNVDVDAMIERIRAQVPIFAELNALMLRETLLDSTIHVMKPGEAVFQRGDYTNSFFTIVDGEVGIEIDANDPAKLIKLGQGEFFGEMGLISGRRRNATVRATAPSLLIETNRRTMLKLRASVDSVRRVMDRTAAMRQIGNLAPFLAGDLVAKLADASSIKAYAAGDTLFRQGDPGDSLHIVRTGSVTVSQRIAGRDMVLSYLPAGSYVGEMALLAETPRTATVKAAVRTETIQIEGEAFKAILAAEPQLRREMERLYNDRIMATERMANAPEAGSIIEFLVRQGLGEATDVLLIDESLCVRCNNCEKACAETHGGVSRLNREAGPSFASIHIPTSCRHCEHPHCMTDCPPNAIHRNPNGEVFITDACIGCGNCERNCPYGVIQMAGPPEKRPGLLNWLLFGLGLGPGESAPHHDDHHADDGGGAAKPKRKTAVKCDMCKDIPAGPSCVRACPTGAALRASPEEFMSLAALTKGR